MPFLPFLPVTVCVNNQKDKNNKAGDHEKDNDGLVSPCIACKVGKIRIHFANLHLFVEFETHDQGPVAFPPEKIVADCCCYCG